jgi:hypothetical protein
LKKLRELLHVRMLHDLRGVVPAGKWDEEGERPDFIIHTRSGQKLGIEVTEYHDSHRDRAREAEKQHLLQQALAAYVEQQGPPVSVRLYWNADPRLEKRQRAVLSRKIARTVLANVPPADSRRSLQTGDLNASGLSTYLHSIEIYCFSEYPDHDWYAPEARFIPLLEPPEVQAIVNGKSAGVDTYRRTDQLWLVVALGMREKTSWAQLAENLRGHVFVGSFDRLFLVSYSDREALELRVLSSSAQPI